MGVASVTVFQSTDIYMGDEACMCTYINAEATHALVALRAREAAQDDDDETMCCPFIFLGR
jgi:hypothetical protein